MIIEKIHNLAPIEAYEKVSHLPRPFIMSFNDDTGRFTYVGASPMLSLKYDRGVMVDGDGAVDDSQLKNIQCPFEALSVINSLLPKEQMNLPFYGGLVGYLSYDLKNIIEEGRFLPYNRAALGDMPLMDMALYDTVFVYDHSEGTASLVSIGADKSGETFKSLSNELKTDKEKKDGNVVFGEMTSNITKDTYLSNIKKVKDYIEAGDIYQINISQAFTTTVSGDSFEIYKLLKEEKDAPFSAYIKLGYGEVIMNSPERLVKVKGNTITTEPIKGTAPRGKTENDDNNIKVKLRADSKECAEHVMIVDMERNDIGKVSKTGTVTVTDFCTIKTFPTLHHMVSTVKGTLKDDINSLTALKEIFPGGSITGAPKVRAMEIIDEVEGYSRSLYTGGIGYITPSGDMDIAMSIRTAIIKDGELHISVGGGIVADSIAEKEYDETILKAMDFTETIKKLKSKKKDKTA